MEKRQTAVDWLVEQIKSEQNQKALSASEWMEVIEQSKRMEKQQMIEFAKGFWYYGNGSDAPPCYNEDVEKYYKKFYSK